MSFFSRPAKRRSAGRTFVQLHSRSPADADLLHQRVGRVVVVSEVRLHRGAETPVSDPRAGGKRHSSPGIRMTVYRKASATVVVSVPRCHTLFRRGLTRAGANADCPEFMDVFSYKTISRLRSHLPVGVAQLWIVRQWTTLHETSTPYSILVLQWSLWARQKAEREGHHKTTVERHPGNWITNHSAQIHSDATAL